MKYTERIGHAYFFAKNYIISKGYWNEIEWQENSSYSKLTQQIFLKEAAWVILASGLNDKVVQIKFPLIMEIMFGFTSPSKISANKSTCYKKALKEFNHPGKINAILYVAEQLTNHSFECIKSQINQLGIDYLKSFPYIGDATAYHLAKNIGLNVAKPDRHLVRMSNALGFTTPAELCMKISDELDEKVALVDLVLWRYATLDKLYLEKISWLTRK
jgi:hypothetical protein